MTDYGNIRTISEGDPLREVANMSMNKKFSYKDIITHIIYFYLWRDLLRTNNSILVQKNGHKLTTLMAIRDCMKNFYIEPINAETITQIKKLFPDINIKEGKWRTYDNDMLTTYLQRYRELIEDPTADKKEIQMCLNTINDLIW